MQTKSRIYERMESERLPVPSAREPLQLLYNFLPVNAGVAALLLEYPPDQAMKTLHRYATRIQSRWRGYRTRNLDSFVLRKLQQLDHARSRTAIRFLMQRCDKLQHINDVFTEENFANNARISAIERALTQSIMVPVHYTRSETVQIAKTAAGEASLIDLAEQ